MGIAMISFSAAPLCGNRQPLWVLPVFKGFVAFQTSGSLQPLHENLLDHLGSDSNSRCTWPSATLGPTSVMKSHE